ncbi:hypothetical protein CFP56_024698 [Quercus suber]|uniref:Ribosomal protein L32 n=1 Tax=Quercus suber TaxID=58331 RepID=A0AAW0K752_QUESU
MEKWKKKRSNFVKMAKWREWLCSKRSLLFPTKCILLKVTSLLRHKAKGWFPRRTLEYNHHL